MLDKVNSCFHHFPVSVPSYWASWVAQLVSSIPRLESSPGEGIGYLLQYSWASLVAQTVKNLPAMQETWIQSLGRKDPLGEGMATLSSILAWRIPWILRGEWTEEPGGLQYMRSQRVR